LCIKLSYSFDLFVHQRILKNMYIIVSTKILSSTTVFNIDTNQKCFLSSKFIILEGFLKDRVTLKIGVMMLKIQLCIAEINYILIYIKI